MHSGPGRTEIGTLTKNVEDPVIRSSESVLIPALILGWSNHKVYFTHVSTEILLKCVRFCLMTNSFSAVITRNLIITMSKLSDFRQIGIVNGDKFYRNIFELFARSVQKSLKKFLKLFVAQHRFFRLKLLIIMHSFGPIRILQAMKGTQE
jgi:hypothetical protein